MWSPFPVAFPAQEEIDKAQHNLHRRGGRGRQSDPEDGHGADAAEQDRQRHAYAERPGDPLHHDESRPGASVEKSDKTEQKRRQQAVDAVCLQILRRRKADLGVAGGDGVGLLFRKGEILRKVPEAEIVPALLEELAKL